MNGWKDRIMDGWVDEWTDRWMNRWSNGWVGGRTNGWKSGWVDEWMDIWMERGHTTDMLNLFRLLPALVSCILMYFDVMTNVDRRCCLCVVT